MLKKNKEPIDLVQRCLNDVKI